jgi:hypothetical protein
MRNEEALLVAWLNKDLQLELEERISISEAEKRLAAYLDDLIAHDFEKLVALLYRIDVNEEKLKQALAENQQIGAGHLIAGLIMERQWQKMQTRIKFGKGPDRPGDVDAW